MVELEAHVVGERIIVNLSGARFTMTFEKDLDGPGILERTHWTTNDLKSFRSATSVPREGLGGCKREGA